MGSLDYRLLTYLRERPNLRIRYLPSAVNLGVQGTDPSSVCHISPKVHIAIRPYAWYDGARANIYQRTAPEIACKHLPSALKPTQRMAEFKVDALMITQDVSRYYRSGFYAHYYALDIAG